MFFKPRLGRPVYHACSGTQYWWWGSVPWTPGVRGHPFCRLRRCQLSKGVQVQLVKCRTCHLWIVYCVCVRKCFVLICILGCTSQPDSKLSIMALQDEEAKKTYLKKIDAPHFFDKMLTRLLVHQVCCSIMHDTSNCDKISCAASSRSSCP